MRAGLADEVLSLPLAAIGDAVIAVHARGNEQFRELTADPADDVADKAGAILEAAAVLAGAIFCREQLRQQIAVALLEIDEIITDLRRQFCCRNKLIFDPFQVVVGQQRKTGIDKSSGAAVARERIEKWFMRCQQRLFVAVAYGVRQLQPDDDIAV